MKRPKKLRKPRGIKLNGRRSLDLCKCCYSFHCDPFLMSKLFYRKVSLRISKGLCPACGHNPCNCKSELYRRY